MQDQLSPIYRAIVMTLMTSSPRLLSRLDADVRNFIEEWNPKERKTELAFYDLSDLFKDNLEFWWDEISVTQNTLSLVEGNELNFLLESILRSATATLGWREYRCLAYLFLDRGTDENIDAYTDDEIGGKLNQLHSCAWDIVEQYDPHHPYALS